MAKYEMTIDGVKITGDSAGSRARSAQDPSPPNLVSLAVRYNQPRELTFTLPTRAPLYGRVKLKIDDVLRFDGRIESEQLDPDLGKSHVYTARDMSVDSDGVQVLKWKWTLGNGALWTMWYAKQSVTLDKLLTEIHNAATVDLKAKGICASATFSGVRSGNVPAMDLKPGSFRQLLEQVLGSLTATKWLYIPGTSGGVFRVVDLFASPSQTIQIPIATVERLPITRSLEGRYSRVHLEARNYTMTGQRMDTLLPAWNTALEADWSVAAVGMEKDLQNVRNPLADVFRKYSFAHLNHTVVPDGGIELLQAVQRFPYDENPVYMSLEIEQIDAENKVLWTKKPALAFYRHARGGEHAHVPNMAKSAYAMILKYAYADEHQMAGVDVGPEGSAYSLYKLDRELRLIVDLQDMTKEFARQTLAMFKDVLISGSIPLAGPVPGWLWDLNARVNVSASGGSTGLEGMGAIVTGFRHDFAGGGRTEIEFSTDRGSFATGLQVMT